MARVYTLGVRRGVLLGVAVAIAVASGGVVLLAQPEATRSVAAPIVDRRIDQALERIEQTLPALQAACDRVQTVPPTFKDETSDIALPTPLGHMAFVANPGQRAIDLQELREQIDGRRKAWTPKGLKVVIEMCKFSGLWDSDVEEFEAWLPETELKRELQAEFLSAWKSHTDAYDALRLLLEEQLREMRAGD